MIDGLENPIARASRLVAEVGIDGWLGENVHHVISFFDKFHKERCTIGDIAEIGVHHGRLFFVMSAAARDAETCYAIDLFEDQDLNVDRSGCGSRSAFVSHAETFFPEVIHRLRLVTCDSLGLTPTAVAELLPTRGLRIFSIDGGHTATHALNDLVLAQELLVGGGLVLLDDFFGPHWPGVTEGFFRYMTTLNRRLAPLLIFENKLFLTTFSEHHNIIGRLEVHIRNSLGEAYAHKWKWTEICGFRTLSCS